MIEKFWKIQRKINKAMEEENENLIDKFGDEQDEIVKKMTDEEFKTILNEKLPNEYKAYIKRLRNN